MIFLFFLIINLSFLVPAVIAQNFNPTSELVTSIGMPINEANAEIETQPLTVETETKKNAENNSKPYTLFYAFHLLNHCFISSKR